MILRKGVGVEGLIKRNGPNVLNGSFDQEGSSVLQPAQARRFRLPFAAAAHHPSRRIGLNAFLWSHVADLLYCVVVWLSVICTHRHSTLTLFPFCLDTLHFGFPLDVDTKNWTVRVTLTLHSTIQAKRSSTPICLVRTTSGENLAWGLLFYPIKPPFVAASSP